MTLLSGSQPSTTNPYLPVGSCLAAGFIPLRAGSTGRDGLQTLPALSPRHSVVSAEQERILEQFFTRVWFQQSSRNTSLPPSSLTLHIPSTTHCDLVSTIELFFFSHGTSCCCVFVLFCFQLQWNNIHLGSSKRCFCSPLTELSVTPPLWTPPSVSNHLSSVTLNSPTCLPPWLVLLLFSLWFSSILPHP